MYKVLTVSSQDNLIQLTRVLWQRRIPHRVIEVGLQQQIWLQHMEHATLVLELWYQLQHNKSITETDSSVQVCGKHPLLQAPVTILVVIVTLLVSLMTSLGRDYLVVSWLSLHQVNFGFQVMIKPGWELIASGQWWRLWSPVLLHFGWLHLVFNLLWWIDLGGRIERQHSSVLLLLSVLIIGIVSNLAQGLASANLFGGLSGVIYGLLGYIWLWDRLNPPQFQLPQGILIFMLLWMVLGISGLLTQLGLGQMANMAHLTGLIVGLVWALLVTFWQRR